MLVLFLPISLMIGDFDKLVMRLYKIFRLNSNDKKNTVSNVLSRDLFGRILKSRIIPQKYVQTCQISKTVKFFSYFNKNKKAQLSLTNPRDAKACQNCSDSTCLQRCR